MGKLECKLSSSQMIILGFAAVILLGALLLMLPVSSKGGEITPFLDCLLTSTSAVCVTGLVVYDTAAHWTVFGQAIIIVLIQIGGMGVITVAAAITMAAGKKISLMQRSTMQDAISAPQVGGIVRFTGFILKGIVIIELLGTAIMAPVFIGDYGFGEGLWMAVFHSISAFCNAGFDIVNDGILFNSLMGYAANPIINLAIMLLIIIGGLGFLTWRDICTNGIHIKRYRMQSKVILTVTSGLILVPTVYFFFFELAHLPFAERFWGALFQAVTPRTAGFNTVDLNAMSETGQMITSLLMIIGGAPGSTAGGMKTTTFAVLILNAFATFRSQENVETFGRRIECSVIKNASTIAMMYCMLFLCGGITISVYEGLPLLECLYEAASAVGTVGLTLGITPKLHIVSQFILIILMYLGRVGGLTLIYAVLSKKKKGNARLPLEKLTVG